MNPLFSGCNVSILKLWNDAKGPMYYTVLHFCFGIGNLLGPVMAELILTEKNSTTIIKESNELFQESNDFDKNFGPTQVEQDIWSSLISSLNLTQLQFLHIVIFVKLLMITLFFVICSLIKDDVKKELTFEDLSKSEKMDSKISISEISEVENDTDKILENSSYPCLKYGFITTMTFMFATTNGINFAYSNFVTKFAVNSNLHLNKSQGARWTAVYFLCSAIMRFVTIGLLKVFKPIRLIIFNVIILGVASLILLTLGNDNLLAYQIGTALAGNQFSNFM